MGYWLVKYVRGDGEGGDMYAFDSKEKTIEFLTCVVGSLCNLNDPGKEGWCVVSPDGEEFNPRYVRAEKSKDNYVELTPW